VILRMHMQIKKK